MKTTLLLPIFIFLASFVQAQQHTIPKNAVYLNELLEPISSNEEAAFYTLPSTSKEFPQKKMCYYLDGKTRAEMYINENDDVAPGKSTWYYEDGSLDRTIEYIDDYNATISFYFEGKNTLYSKTIYKDNGDQISEIYYSNGKTRELSIKSVSKEGIMKIATAYFDKNGKEIATSKTTGTFEDMQIDGTELIFNESTEEIIQKDVYKKGKLISSKSLSDGTL